MWSTLDCCYAVLVAMKQLHLVIKPYKKRNKNLNSSSSFPASTVGLINKYYQSENVLPSVSLWDEESTETHSSSHIYFSRLARDSICLHLLFQMFLNRLRASCKRLV